MLLPLVVLSTFILSCVASLEAWRRSGLRTAVISLLILPWPGFLCGALLAHEWTVYAGSDRRAYGATVSEVGFIGLAVWTAGVLTCALIGRAMRK